MNEDDSENIILEEYENEFSYKKSKSNLNIQFNRVAFIFFIFFIISLIYSVHLLHLGSLKKNTKEEVQVSSTKNYRADIIDTNGNYLVKTVRTIDVGINPLQVIDKKHLLLMLNYIFPEKKKIQERLNGRKFFFFRKKY